MREQVGNRLVFSIFTGRKWLIGSVGLAVLALSFAAVKVRADEYPSPRGFVNDFAQIISPADANLMESLLRQLRDRAGIEMAVVTVRSLDGRPIEDYANELFRRWGIGSQQENTGLLLLVAPSERQYRLEVGYGLEADIPDGLAGEIGREMVPYFRRQAYSEGITLAVDSIVATLAEKRGIEIEGANPQLAYRESTDRSPGINVAIGIGIGLLILIVVVVVIVVASDSERRGGPRGGGRHRRYHGSDWLWYPIIFGGGGSGGFGGHRGGSSSGSSGWGSSGGFGGFSGGGGFGGFGGGSSGGGGASGSW